jgi:N-acetylglutamate synthase-like GNAT family acetyltransferase
VIKEMDNRLLIRPATDADMQAAFKLIGELGYPDVDFNEFATTYSSVQNHPGMTLLLAEHDGDVVGLASISRRPQLRLAGDLITIDELVVADTARGLGVGRSLLQHVKTMSQDSGARRLELETTRTRESYERSFYVKNGFTEADSAVMRINFANPGNQKHR